MRTTEAGNMQVNRARIRNLRERGGLSVRAAAAAARTSPGAWHDLESGRTQHPGRDFLARVAEVLQVTPADLCHGRRVRQPNTNGGEMRG
jgi:transcriptional regulator with XRE-family HTH domain